MKQGGRFELKQRMIIIMHTDYPQKEGMSYRVHQMAKALSLKYAVTVLAPMIENPNSLVHERVERYDVRRIALGIPEGLETNRILFRFFFIFTYTLSMIRFWRTLIKGEIKFIQAEQQLSLLPAIVLSRLMNVPLIVDDALGFEKYYEHFPRYIRTAAWIFEMLSFHRCKLIICSSSIIAQSFPRVYKISPLKIRVIVNGVELLPVKNQQLGLNTSSKDVVFIASMYSQQNLKAIKNLIKMFADISKEVETARLFIIGDPTYMLGTKYLQKLRKFDNVFLLGRISEEEKRRYLRSASVCPLPFDPKDTLMGGIRLKSLECLANGKVVVSTSSGVEGIVGAIDGFNLLIRDDLKEFEKCMANVLKYPERYKRIGKHAVKLASKYQWKNILASYLNIAESM